MPPQDPVQAFTPEVRADFETYLNALCTTNRNLMNATKRAQYISFFADPEQKITEKDKAEKKRLHAEKRRAIKEFCVDSRGQLLHVAQKKRYITKPQAFVYDAFDYIEQYMLQGVTMGIKRLFSK